MFDQLTTEQSSNFNRHHPHKRVTYNHLRRLVRGRKKGLSTKNFYIVVKGRMVSLKFTMTYNSKF